MLCAVDIKLNDIIKCAGQLPASIGWKLDKDLHPVLKANYTVCFTDVTFCILI